MRPGDTGRYWHYYDDQFIRVKVAAQPADDRVLARNGQLAAFIVSTPRLSDAKVWSFVPEALAGGLPDVRHVTAVMTGGRSFRLGERAAAQLGLPSRACLDLDRLGWGKGLLELRLEVKGAGTLWSRTQLDAHRVEGALRSHPGLARSWTNARKDEAHPVIMSSLFEYLGRNRGGQSELCGVSAVTSSEALLGGATVRFLPAWLCVAHSPAIHEHLRVVTRGSSAPESLHEGTVVNELRFSPGSVRAVYFDTAASDAVLERLALRVSRDLDELEECAVEMIHDSRRYLELLSASTRPTPCGLACTWTKIGDIHEIFDPGDNRSYPDIHEYKEVKKVAWFLAKDEIVVRRVGKLFTDMESCSTAPRGFLSLLGQEMRRHHELFVLNVLRDHCRVITQFEIARALVAGAKLNRDARRAIERSVLSRIQDAINQSESLSLDLAAATAHLTIVYPALGRLSVTYDLPRRWLVERYA